MNMYKLLSISILLLMMTSPTSRAQIGTISEQVDYYHSAEKPLTISTSIDVRPLDIATGPGSRESLVNGSWIHPRTTYESGWIGALPLNKGYAVDGFDELEDVVKGTFNFSVDELTMQQANLSIVFNSYHKNKHWTTVSSLSLFDGTVSKGTKGNGSISDNIVGSASVLANGSLIPNLSYLQLLNTTTTWYYSTLSIRFEAVSDLTWNDTASVTVTYEGEHNPSLYELMLDRMKTGFLTSSTQGDSSKDDTSFSWYTLGFTAVIITYVLRRRG